MALDHSCDLLEQVWPGGGGWGRAAAEICNHQPQPAVGHLNDQIGLGVFQKLHQRGFLHLCQTVSGRSNMDLSPEMFNISGAGTTL